MQDASGGGESAAGIEVAGGGAEVDRRILVFVGAAGTVRAESGRRRSGQAGHCSGAAQVESVARTAECGSGGDLRSAGGRTFRNGRERGGGAVGVLRIEGAGA